MENTTLSIGEVVPTSGLPAEFQAQPETMQEAADNHGCDISDITAVSIVPAESDVSNLETELAQSVSALETVQSLRKTLENAESITPSAARALMVTLERQNVTLRLPSREAFATGDKAVTFYAKEALAAQEQTLMNRVIELFMKWAKDTYLWVQSILSRRGRAKEAVEFAQKNLPQLTGIKLSPTGFSGARWCLGLDYTPGSSQQIDAAAAKSASLLDDLSWQMRDLLANASKLFNETLDSESGVLRSMEALKSLAVYINDEREFNKSSIGGFSWTLKASENYRTANAGQPLPVFSVELNGDGYREMDKDIEGTLSAAAFGRIVKASSVALAQSETVISALTAYGKNLSRLGAKKSNNFFADTQDIKSLLTASTALRQSASYYDRVVCTVALDCGRAMKFAVRKT